MMKNLLLDNDEVTTASLPLQPEGLTRLINCTHQHSPVRKSQHEIQHVTSVASTSDDIVDLIQDHKRSFAKDDETNNDDDDNDDGDSFTTPNVSALEQSPRDIEHPCRIKETSITNLESRIESNQEEHFVGSSPEKSINRVSMIALPPNSDPKDSGENGSNPLSDAISLSSDDDHDDSLSSCSGRLSSHQQQYPDSSSVSSSASSSSSSSLSSSSSSSSSSNSSLSLESSSFPLTNIVNNNA